MTNWHQLNQEQVLNQLKTSLESGLSNEAAARLREDIGPNELIERGAKSPWAILWEQLSGIMVVILIISAAISILLHEYTDAVVILIIVFIVNDKAVHQLLTEDRIVRLFHGKTHASGTVARFVIHENLFHFLVHNHLVNLIHDEMVADKIGDTVAKPVHYRANE